jgi:hypothetical protein
VPILEVSDDATWFHAFGVEPQTEGISGDEFVRELRIPTTGAEALHISWDEADRSVRVRWLRATKTLVELFREQVTALRVETTGADSVLIMEYGSPDVMGHVVIQVGPEVTFKDTFMRT